MSEAPDLVRRLRPAPARRPAVRSLAGDHSAIKPGPSEIEGRAVKASRPAKGNAETAAPARKRHSRNAAFETALGHRIRAARIAADLSQTDLGEAIAVSFQQVQKYEQGRDRVSASTLRDIAAAVQLPPASFYGDDLSAPSGGIAAMRTALRLAQRLQRVRDPKVLASIIALVDQIAGPPNAGTAPG